MTEQRQREPAAPVDQQRRDQLVDQGFCTFEQLLPDRMLERLQSISNRLLDEQPQADKDRAGNQGAYIQFSFQDPVMQDLIAWPPALEALNRLGFRDIRFWSGFIICREPNTRPLYFHQDWPFWDHPVSADPVPHQLFLMWYLTDTRPENGCLRVIPTSHRRRFDLHEDLGSGHDGELRYEDGAHPAYQQHPEEIDVPVQAGDVVVGDARLLHAAHGNQTDERRIVLTLWYLPRFGEAPEPVRAGFQLGLNDEWLAAAPPGELEKIRPLIMDYDGGAASQPWNRVPGEHLTG